MVTIVYHLLQEAQTAISIRSTVRLRKDRLFAGVIDTISEIQLHFLLKKKVVSKMLILYYFSFKTDLDKPSNVRLFINGMYYKATVYSYNLYPFKRVIWK